MAYRLLSISSGHGEDNHASYIIRALRERRSEIEISAVPVSGLGRDYSRLGVPIVGPTKVMPSGGFFYQQKGAIWDDIRAGLIGLTLGQILAVRRAARRHDGVLAVGDVVSQTLAWLSGLPWVGFISPLSALQRGRVPLSEPLPRVLASQRCWTIATKDPVSARDLRDRGFAHARVGGMVAVDWLKPGGRDLEVPRGARVVAVLPGSRPPEATRNLGLLLHFIRAAERAARGAPPLAWRAALVAAVRAEVPALAASEGWNWDGAWLSDPETGAQVFCPDDAFADIVHAAEAGVGLAGLALEQVAAAGKPILQFPGEGPQFIPRFVRRQERLLGELAHTVSMEVPGPEAFDTGAATLLRLLDDPETPRRFGAYAAARFCPEGASYRIADMVLAMLDGAAAGRPRRPGTQDMLEKVE
ncbi:MAG: lipid-A-disaccharide synthase-related protein [Paracoccaceae bacterium]|nr:lipid-A-disaccharide synthase-related protein [Paracoccaceae bacterium]